MKHIFDVDIAKEYGIEIAILLENMNFWLEKNRANNTNFFDGRYWTYNSIKGFEKLFPYWSKDKIYRILKKAEDLGLIIKGNYNKMTYDRTTWYAFSESAESIFENCNIHFADLQNGIRESAKPIPDINTDINTDNKKEIYKEKIPYQEIIDCLNSLAGTRYRATTNDTKKFIKARWDEGFTLIDFQTVIKKKCDEWIGTEYEKFLRPQTLFSTKFENYLNQKDNPKQSNNPFLDWLKQMEAEENDG